MAKRERFPIWPPVTGSWPCSTDRRRTPCRRSSPARPWRSAHVPPAQHQLHAFIGTVSAASTTADTVTVNLTNSIPERARAGLQLRDVHGLAGHADPWRERDQRAVWRLAERLSDIAAGVLSEPRMIEKGFTKSSQFAGIYLAISSACYGNMCSIKAAKDRTMDKKSLELLLTEGHSIERIAKRFGKDPSTVSYWMRKHGLISPYAQKHATRGGLERERLEILVEAGLTIAEIAQEVQRSKATVRHWLRRFGMKTKNGVGTRRPGANTAAKEAGLLSTVMSCERHGETEFVLEGRGHYRCRRCRSEAVTRHRRKIKAILVREAGGCCCICGYDRHPGALEFHHVDPAQKLHEVGRYGVTLALDAARLEASKCILLCSNCHAEVEGGGVDLPATVAPTLRSPETIPSG